MISTQITVFQSALANQRPKSDVIRILKRFQSVLYDNTVFIAKFHDIRHRWKCCKRKVFFIPFSKGMGFIIHLIIKEGDHFPGNHRPADSVERIGVARNFRINQSIGFRKVLRLYLMVIGHDHRHSLIFGTFNRPGGCDSVITGNDRIHAVRCGLIYNPLIQPIAVPDSLGNIPADIASQFFDSRKKNVGRTNPVAVIIADDTDFLPASYFFRQYSGSFSCASQKMRIMKILQRTVQISINLIIANDIAVSDDPCDHRADMIFLSNFLKISLLSVHPPVLFLHKISLIKRGRQLSRQPSPPVIHLLFYYCFSITAFLLPLFSCPDLRPSRRMSSFPASFRISFRFFFFPWQQLPDGHRTLSA